MLELQQAVNISYHIGVYWENNCDINWLVPDKIHVIKIQWIWRFFPVFQDSILIVFSFVPYCPRTLCNLVECLIVCPCFLCFRPPCAFISYLASNYYTTCTLVSSTFLCFKSFLFRFICSSISLSLITYTHMHLHYFCYFYRWLRNNFYNYAKEVNVNLINVDL